MIYKEYLSINKNNILNIIDSIFCDGKDNKWNPIIEIINKDNDFYDIKARDIYINKEEEKIVVNYFDLCESCPKCYEAKKLGNKYYHQLDNLNNRISEYVCSDISNLDFEKFQKKLDGMFIKFDKIQTEFIGIIRGRVKCCCPQWVLDDYLDAWKESKI